MRDEPIIELNGVSKSYSIESHPWRRLWGQLSGRGTPGQQYNALHDVCLQVRRGEVVGIVGRNGAGKSTLLQLVCGVLEPTAGTRIVRGRVAALLELGAGFNPELTGRENVRLNGPLLGVSQAQMNARMEAIADFAGIGNFIDQPVRSYSSGMFVRLAFSMATSLDPEILVVDEALSVGDGTFARKSLDRIMELKDRGVTILFCSHSLYHVDSICSRALWLDQGRIRMAGPVAAVVAAYNDHISAASAGVVAQAAAPVGAVAVPAAVPVAHAAGVEAAVEAGAVDVDPDTPRADAAMALDTTSATPAALPSSSSQARITRLTGRTRTQSGRVLMLHTQRDDLTVEVDYTIDPSLPPPTMLTAIYTRSGILVASAGSHNDAVQLAPDAAGAGHVALTFRRLPLLKGNYYLNVFLACERGLHYYEAAMQAIELEVTQDGLEQGIVTLEKQWS